MSNIIYVNYDRSQIVAPRPYEDEVNTHIRANGTFTADTSEQDLEMISLTKAIT